MTFRWSHILVGLLVALAAIPTNALAQRPGVELFATGALQKLWDDEGSIGTGGSAGGGMGLVITDRLIIRGRVSRATNQRDFGNGVIFEAATTRYTVDVLWHLSDVTHAPYVGVGAGGFSYRRSSTFPGEQTTSRTGTDSILGGLAGFTAMASGRFRLRPEASLWWSQPENFIVIEAAVVAAWRF
jgi:hypothetical protein